MFLDEWVSITDKEKDKLKMMELFDSFRNLCKGRCEDTMTIRAFSQSVERHGLCKTKSGGVMYIKKIKWKTNNDNLEFLPDAAQAQG